MSERYFEPGKWKVSPLNFIDAVTNQLRLPERVQILDVTLRDGAQMAGVAFTVEEHALYAEKADEIGVAYLEIIPERDPKAFQAVRDLSLNAKLISLSSAIREKDWKKGLDSIMDVGVDWMSLSHPHPSTPAWLTLKPMSEDEWIDRLIEAIEYIKGRGFPCVASLVDATRTDLRAAKRFAKAAVEAGVDRVKMCDTMGVSGPAAFKYLINAVKDEVPKTPIQVHIHNDFGCATSNALASVEAGAEVVDAAVNGLGDHGGNPSLVTVAVALRVLYGVDTGINFEKLREISYFVEDLTKFPMALNEPLVGRRYFYDTHYQWLLAGKKMGDPFVASAILPEVLGMKRRILPGRLTTPMAIQEKLKELGIDVPKNKLPKIVERVHEEALIRKKVLEDDDMLEIAKKILD